MTTSRRTQGSQGRRRQKAGPGRGLRRGGGGTGRPRPASQPGARPRRARKAKATATTQERAKRAPKRPGKRASKGAPKRARDGARKQALPKAASPAGRSCRAAGLTAELTVSVWSGKQRRAKRVEVAGAAGPGAARNKPDVASPREWQSAAGRVSRGSRPDQLARLLAALAHPQRVTILLKLLAGEATHRLLSKATGLKAGPLYHHIRELRAAGLIGPKVRDLYTLTATGERAILAALALERMCR